MSITITRFTNKWIANVAGGGAIFFWFASQTDGWNQEKMDISRLLQSNEKKIGQTMFLIESKLEEMPKDDIMSVLISLLVSFSSIAVTIAVLSLLRKYQKSSQIIWTIDVFPSFFSV